MRRPLEPSNTTGPNGGAGRLPISRLIAPDNGQKRMIANTNERLRTTANDGEPKRPITHESEQSRPTAYQPSNSAQITALKTKLKWCGGIGLFVRQNRQSSGPTSATREKEGAHGASPSELSRLLKSRVIHFRVTAIEEAAMRAAADARDLRMSAFVRLAALHFAGAPTAAECEALGVNDAIRHLDGAANNLNQLARAANKARGIVMSNSDREVMAALGDRVEDAQSRFLTYRATATKRPGQLILPITGKDQ